MRMLEFRRFLSKNLGRRNLCKTLVEKIETISYRVESFGKRVCHKTTWFLMLILNPGHRFSEVVKQEMSSSESVSSKDKKTIVSDVEVLLVAASSQYDNAINRGKTINEKNKVLLTVAALLLAASAALAPHIDWKWLILIPLLPLVSSIYLILVHFGVQKVRVPNWESVRSARCGQTAKRKLALDYWECSHLLEPRNDFRVGVYRTAARAMTLGAVFMVILFIALIASPSHDKKIIDVIKKDSNLQQSLRGATGASGPVGPRGPAGPKGKQGSPCISNTLNKPPKHPVSQSQVKQLHDAPKTPIIHRENE